MNKGNSSNLLILLIWTITGIIIGGVIVFSYFTIFGAGSSSTKVQNELYPDLALNKDLSPDEIDVPKEEIKKELGSSFSEDDISSAISYLKFKKINENFVPSGTPLVYGEKLGVSFDKVQEAINKIQVYGPDYGTERIKLTSERFKRYKDITSKTSCEYCCGAKSLIREDGSAACGCAHSIMMRGLAAFLLQNYPSLSNQVILDELNRWKRTFFPKQTLTAYLQELKGQGKTDVDKILNEFPGFMPKMVGGC